MVAPLALAAAAGAQGTPLGAAPAVVNATPADQFSMGIASHLPPPSQPGRADDGKTIGDIAFSELGATSLRDEVGWDEMDNPAYPEWTDQFKVVAQHGGKLVLTLDYGSGQMTGGGFPDNPAERQAFLQFANRAIAKIGPENLAGIEIWNEWNTYMGWFADRPAWDDPCPILGDSDVASDEPGCPAMYGKLVEALLYPERDGLTEPSLRQSAPGVPVLANAIEARDSAWTQASMAYLRDHQIVVDGAVVHPYYLNGCTSGQAAPGSPQAAVDCVVATADEVASAYGQALPMWVTEMGWARQAVGADAQARNLVESYVKMRATKVTRGVWWYDLQDDGTDTTDDQQTFGLVGCDPINPGGTDASCSGSDTTGRPGATHPAGQAFSALAHFWAGCSSVDGATTAGNRAFQLSCADGARQIILEATAGDLAQASATGATLVDLLGQQADVPAGGDVTPLLGHPVGVANPTPSSPQSSASSSASPSSPRSSASPASSVSPAGESSSVPSTVSSGSVVSSGESSAVPAVSPSGSAVSTSTESTTGSASSLRPAVSASTPAPTSGKSSTAASSTATWYASTAARPGSSGTPSTPFTGSAATPSTSPTPAVSGPGTSPASPVVSGPSTPAPSSGSASTAHPPTTPVTSTASVAPVAPPSGESTPSPSSAVASTPRPGPSSVGTSASEPDSSSASGASTPGASSATGLPSSTPEQSTVPPSIPSGAESSWSLDVTSPSTVTGGLARSADGVDAFGVKARLVDAQGQPRSGGASRLTMELPATARLSTWSDHGDGTYTTWLTSTTATTLTVRLMVDGQPLGQPAQARFIGIAAAHATLARGQSQTVTGLNFLPGEQVVGALNSDVVNLGTVTVGPDGSAAFTVSTADVSPGHHSIVLTGAVSGMQEVGFEVLPASGTPAPATTASTVPPTVSATAAASARPTPQPGNSAGPDGSLARTGASGLLPRLTVLAGVAFLGAGACLMLWWGLRSRNSVLTHAPRRRPTTA